MSEALLVNAWAGIIAFAVFAYIVMDGFDLGIGILFPLLPSEAERATAINAVAPVWDGNETWLILGGAGLMAAFPLAYAVLMPALYAPIMAMLLGLIFRGVAFEFRWRTQRDRWLWDLAFAVGSTVAAFMQGASLGAILHGISVQGRHYAGGPWDWLSPFSVLTGLALCAGYATLGACWLIMKSRGVLRGRARRLALGSGAALLAGVIAVSLATPWLHNDYYQRWFTWPSILLTGLAPLLVVLATVLFLQAIRRGWERAPFLLTLGLFTLTYFGLMFSVFPFLVPYSITVTAAAAPASSLKFMLAGTAVLLPVVLGYTAHNYWVFRGKVGTEEYK
jgi:cytochrome d ubiquinol oxidase subunit II